MRYLDECSHPSTISLGWHLIRVSSLLLYLRQNWVVVEWMGAVLTLSILQKARRDPKLGTKFNISSRLLRYIIIRLRCPNKDMVAGKTSTVCGQDFDHGWPIEFEIFQIFETFQFWTNGPMYITQSRRDFNLSYNMDCVPLWSCTS